MWLRADYNERMYVAKEDNNDKYISSTSINSWVWWKPFLISLDTVVGCLILYWFISSTTKFIEINKEENE